MRTPESSDGHASLGHFVFQVACRERKMSTTFVDGKSPRFMPQLELVPERDGDVGRDRRCCVAPAHGS